MSSSSNFYYNSSDKKNLRLINVIDQIKSAVPSREFSEKDKDSLLLEIINHCICKIVKYGDEMAELSHDEFMPPNRKLPSISVKDYLSRLMKYAPCSKECFIASLVYMDKLINECGFVINSLNIHRILITTLLISTKYLDDIFYNNEFYSQVGGVSLSEMNSLELSFLKLLKFTAFFSVSTLLEYQKEIEISKDRFLNFLNFGVVTKLSISSPIGSSPSNLSPRRSNQTIYQSSRRGSCDHHYDPNRIVQTKDNQQVTAVNFHTNCVA